MKKICLILIILMVLSLFTSCNTEHSARLVDFDVISYNDSLYYAKPWNSNFSIYYYYEDPWVYEEVDSINSPRIKVDFPLMRAWIYCENHFGDNILLLWSWNAGHLSFYFKEGFVFPQYNEVALSKILLERGKTESIIEFSDDEIITWKDIIDYSTSIKTENNSLSYWCYGELKDYSTCLCTGTFYVVEIDDVVYINVDCPTQEDNTYYKISKEYQQAFKDALNNSNK